MMLGSIIVETPCSLKEHISRCLNRILSTYTYLSRFEVFIVENDIFDECFYAENSFIIDSNGDEVFLIRISRITPEELIEDILNVELHKAYLYFTNKAVKSFRWRAGYIFFNKIEEPVARAIYAKLVDTVENGVVVKLNPKVYRVFIDTFLDEEVYDEPLDYVISQAMIAPAYISGLITPQKQLDDIEALAVLLSTYSLDLYENPSGSKGVEIAEELFMITQYIREYSCWTTSS